MHTMIICGRLSTDAVILYDVGMLFQSENSPLSAPTKNAAAARTFESKNSVARTRQQRPKSHAESHPATGVFSNRRGRAPAAVAAIK